MPIIPSASGGALFKKLPEIHSIYFESEVFENDFLAKIC
jgi:hypothetical protein